MASCPLAAAGAVFMLLRLAMVTATDGGFHAARSTGVHPSPR